MEIMEADVLLKEWKRLSDVLEKQYGEKPTLEAILFLIGVQELAAKRTEFSKDEKQDIIHIAICRLLSHWNFYEYKGRDADGWPIWEVSKDIPYLSLMQQSRLLREGILKYFKEMEFEY